MMPCKRLLSSPASTPSVWRTQVKPRQQFAYLPSIMIPVRCSSNQLPLLIYGPFRATGFAYLQKIETTICCSCQHMPPLICGLFRATGCVCVPLLTPHPEYIAPRALGFSVPLTLAMCSPQFDLRPDQSPLRSGCQPTVGSYNQFYS